MGHFHFDVPPGETEFLDRTLWRDAYLCGIEGVPFPTQVSREDHRLKLQRQIDSSARLIIPATVDGRGIRTLSTCSLRPNSTSDVYPLTLELARGCCSQLRTQSAAWEQNGLRLDAAFRQVLRDGTGLFLEAASLRASVEKCHRTAWAAVEKLQDGLDQLAELYAIQSMTYRKNRQGKLSTLFAASTVPPCPVSVGTSRSGDGDSDEWSLYRATFNSMAIRTSWADVETDSGTMDFDQIETAIAAAERAGMRIMAGPIIDFRHRLMPHWLYLLEDNFESFLKSAVDFTEKLVARFCGRVQLWNVAAGLNTPGPMSLTDEQAMRLAVGILQTVRRGDPTTAAILSFDQPCGEYLARHRDAISPIHFADAIIRSGLGMAGIGIDFRMGYSTDATSPRGAVDIGNAIDRWATLGMPLMVTVGIPGGIGRDDHAIAPSTLLSTVTSPGGPADHQLETAAPILRTLFAKPIVHAIVWDGWHDGKPHVHSHSGLIDAKGNERPLRPYCQRLKTELLDDA